MRFSGVPGTVRSLAGYAEGAGGGGLTLGDMGRCVTRHGGFCVLGCGLEVVE